jgi:hypothetical protein
VVVVVLGDLLFFFEHVVGGMTKDKNKVLVAGVQLLH